MFLDIKKRTLKYSGEETERYLRERALSVSGGRNLFRKIRKTELV